jgi:hypothetical protein
MRAKSVGKLSAALFCSIAHLVALFVGNEQTIESRALSTSNCALWNFWLPYFVALNTWFVFMSQRMLAYGMIMRGDYHIESPRWRTFLSAFFVLLISTPILSICIANSIKGLSYVDPGTGSCTSALLVRICILVWVVMDFCTLYLLNQKVNGRISVEHINDFRAVRDGMIGGVLAIGVFSGIHFGGLQNKSEWRTLQLFTIATMYMFSFLRIIGYTLVCALRNDREYAASFRRRIDLASAPEQIQELMRRDDMLEDFLKFCEKGGTFHVRVAAGGDDKSTRTYTGAQYVICIRALNRLNFTDPGAIDDFMEAYIRRGESPTFVYINVALHKSVEKFIKDKNGTRFVAMLSMELHFVLSVQYFDSYRAEPMKRFLAETQGLDADNLGKDGLLMS